MPQGAGALMTAVEFAHVPDSGLRRELVRGEVVDRPPASAEAGRVSANVGARIHSFVESSGAGYVYAAAGFVLTEGPDTVRGPSIAFVVKDRANAPGGPDGFFPGAPDLAVEVVSPTDEAADMQAKVTEYLGAGTALVWVVYPKTRQVVIHRPEGEATVAGEDAVLTGEPVLPGLSIPVKDVFAK